MASLPGTVLQVVKVLCRVHPDQGKFPQNLWVETGRGVTHRRLTRAVCGMLAWSFSERGIGSLCCRKKGKLTPSAGERGWRV